MVATGGRLNLLNALGSVAPPSLSINNVSLAEGNGGDTTAYTFTVTLSAASSQTVTVNWGTVNGSAVAGSDFTAANDTLTFNPGETSKTVTVFVTGDDVYESTETFLVQLSGATNAVVSGGGGVGTITNDDLAPMPVVGISDDSDNEGNSGFNTFTFTLTLSAASPQSTSVRWSTVAGTALAGADFTAASGTVTFNPGEVSKTVKIKVKGDRTAEPNENFTVVLSTPSNLTIGRGVGIGTIVNDDGGTFNSVRAASASSPRLADLFRALGDFDMDWLAPSLKRKR
jgi:hypothetical protein